jgi:hypothetical protein
MKLNKAVADWANVNPVAAVEGGAPQAETVLSAALQDIATLGAALEALVQQIERGAFRDELDHALTSNIHFLAARALLGARP